VIEDLTRVTPKERVSDALTELGNASNAMIEGRYKVALRSARRAKDLAPRDATVRETLGLAAYRVGDWLTALTELRVYRRLAGESTHMPIEMDALRALDRKPDVAKVWAELQKADASPAVLKEGLVVYASFLIDEGRLEEARRLATPKRIKPNPYPADLRVWYVAARANALVGDTAAARKMSDAITVADPAFPGMDDLETIIARSAP
jgi:Flp pilus assembly protein TadD